MTVPFARVKRAEMQFYEYVPEPNTTTFRKQNNFFVSIAQNILDYGIK